MLTDDANELDRLPTLSASQALDAQQSQRSQHSTGSTLLDSLLGDEPYAIIPPAKSYTTRLVTSGSLGAEASGRESEKEQQRGGLAKGKLTEVCGPPGSGKTAFAIQVAANALLAGEKVTWIETAQPLPIARLITILTHLGDPDPHSTLYSLRIIKCPTLAHLLAIIHYPPSTFPDPGTGVLVIDNISTLFSIAFPPGIDGEFLDRKSAGCVGKVQPSVRRVGIMVDLVGGLGKVAGMRNIVELTGAGEKVLVLNQLTTRIIRGVGAYLQPAVASPSWTNSFTTRLLIFRHHVPADILKSPETATSVRYISILKAGGVSYENEDGPIISVTISENGISDVEYLPDTDPSGTPRISQPQPPSPTPSTAFPPEPGTNTDNQSPPRSSKSGQPTLLISPLKSQGKRKREIADSEDEDGEDGREVVYAAWGDGVEPDSIQQAVGFGEEGLRRFGEDRDGDGGGDYEDL
ncbi:P-loop containing nucleoside triphosphate hydrolase protein [Tirmania nivea]|nr:P-loop containing nucleoside triphosphate hydrolase protein [Tirmania nivea]